MSTQGPGWLDEPEHDEPVQLEHAIDDWLSSHIGPQAVEGEKP